MAKQNLPNSTTELNLVSEKNHYLYLYDLKPRSAIGNISFTSTTSGETYSTETYLSGYFENQGQEGLLLILKDVLKDYLITADDYNYFVDSVTQVNDSFTEINEIIESNISNVKEQLTRNSYDDYQLWLELYYKGYISQVEAENAKAIIFDGFMDDDNIETNHYDLSSAVPSDTKTKSLYTAPCYVKFTTDETFGSVKNLSFPFKITSTPSGDYFMIRIVGSDAITGAPDDTVELGYYKSDTTGLSSPLLVDFGEVVTLEPNKSYFFKISQYGNISSAYYSLYYNDLNINPTHQLWIDGAQVGNQEIIMSWEKIPSNVEINLIDKFIGTGNYSTLNAPVYVHPISISSWENPSYNDEVQNIMSNNVIDNNATTSYYATLPVAPSTDINSYKYFGQMFDLGSIRRVEEFNISLSESGLGNLYYQLLKIQYSLDGIIWNDVNGDTGAYYITSDATYSFNIGYNIARYIRISDRFYNSDTADTSTFYVYEYKFRTLKNFDSSLLTDTKTLPFTPALVDLYVSVKEMTSAKVNPFVSFDDGVNYTAMVFVYEREDSKFDGYTEKHYQLEGVGTDIKLKFNLTTDTATNLEFVLIKRYGLIIS